MRRKPPYRQKYRSPTYTTTRQAKISATGSRGFVCWPAVALRLLRRRALERRHVVGRRTVALLGFDIRRRAGAAHSLVIGLVDEADGRVGSLGFRHLVEQGLCSLLRNACASAGRDEVPFSLASIFQVAKSARARVSARRAISMSAALIKWPRAFAAFLESGLYIACEQQYQPDQIAGRCPQYRRNNIKI